MWVYLSFRIQYIASQVILPVGFIILNTVVFGSYCVSRDDLFTTIWKLKTFGLIVLFGYGGKGGLTLFIHLFFTPTFSIGMTFEVFGFFEHISYALLHIVYPIFLYFHTWFNIQTTKR